jgi:hypothetical protein
MRTATGLPRTSISIAAIERSYAFNWPFGPPRPDLYFDPDAVARAR